MSKFFCENCKQEHESDGDPIYHPEMYGNAPQEQLSSICEDCYKKFYAWFDSLTEADHARLDAKRHGQPYDDTVCANCGMKLPDNPAEGQPAFDGFCTEECRAAWYAKYSIRTVKESS